MSPSFTYEDVTRDYVSLPADQTRFEQLLLKYKKGKAFTNSFQYVEQMAKVN